MLEMTLAGIAFFLVSVGWLWYSHIMLDTMFPKIEDKSEEEEE